MNEKANILRDRARMCEGGFCSRCEISAIDEKLCCYEIHKKYPEKVVEVVEAWAKAHPEKTYKQDFLEKFPEATLSKTSHPLICRRMVYGGECPFGDCNECWNEAMKE